MRVRNFVAGFVLAVVALSAYLTTPVGAQQVMRIYGTTSGTPIALLATAGGVLRVTLDGGTASATTFLAGDGTAAAPSYSFTSAPTHGIFKAGAGSVDISVGTRQAGWDAAGNYYLLTNNSAVVFGAATDTTLVREGAAHLFQRNTTTAERLSVANIYTSSTNYESFSVDWQTTANVLSVGSRTAATGTGRAARFVSQGSSAADAYGMVAVSNTVTGVPFGRMGLLTSTLTNVSTATQGTYFQIGESTSTATAGTNVNTAILPTYNQASGTAANTDLLINRTQTAVGSGQQLLLAAQIAGVAKHYVTADGTARGVQEAFIQATALTCTAANSCGTGNGTFATGSSDTAGSVTLGTTPASGFIIGFGGTWVAAPVCSVWMNKAGMVVGKMPLTTVTSTTTITVVTNGTAPATGDIYAYRCTGIQ